MVGLGLGEGWVIGSLLSRELLCVNNSHTQQKVRRARDQVDSEKKTTLPAVGI